MSTAFTQQQIEEQGVTVQDPDKQQKIQSYMYDKVAGNFTQKEIDVLKQTIAAGTNKEEFGLFLQTCISSGLNPFLNHIHPVVFDGRNGRTLSIQISVEGILSLARRQEGYKGVEVQLVHEQDEFKAARIDGQMQVLTHSLSFPRGQVVGGYAIARREGYADVVVLMEAAEVEHLKSGRNSRMWTTYFNDMFKKHLTKRAAKEQYGIEISEDAPEPVNMPAEPAAGLRQIKERQGRPEAPKVIHLNEKETVTEEDLQAKLWAEIEEAAAAYGMDKTAVVAAMEQQFNFKPLKDITPAELAGFKKLLILKNSKQQPKQEPEVLEMQQPEPTQQRAAHIDLFNMPEPEAQPEEPEEVDELAEYEAMFN